MEFHNLYRRRFSKAKYISYETQKYEHKLSPNSQYINLHRRMNFNNEFLYYCPQQYAEISNSTNIARRSKGFVFFYLLPNSIVYVMFWGIINVSPSQKEGNISIKPNCGNSSLFYKNCSILEIESLECLYNYGLFHFS